MTEHLRGRRTLPLILSANGNSILKWWETHSPTETDVGADDEIMPAVCWTRHFMMAQGWLSGQRIVPGQQQERHSFGEEWQCFEQQAREAYEHLLIFIFLFSDNGNDSRTGSQGRKGPRPEQGVKRRHKGQEGRASERLDTIRFGLVSLWSKAQPQECVGISHVTRMDRGRMDERRMDCSTRQRERG
jgi:hypothetical protein